MVIDTSALLAILQNEPERRMFNEAIEAAETRSMSTASFLEISMIVESRYGADGVRDLDLLIAKAKVSLVPVDEDQAHLARQGFQKFGKGRHPAGLNYGDCFSVRPCPVARTTAVVQGKRFLANRCRVSSDQWLDQLDSEGSYLPRYHSKSCKKRHPLT